MLISICGCFSCFVFAWATFLTWWLGTYVLLCIVAALDKSCLFICISLYICEDNAFALTSLFGMGWNLWDCEGAVDLRVHTQASSPPLQNSARRPQCVPVLPSLERPFSLLKSETDSGAFLNLPFPREWLVHALWSEPFLKHPVLSKSQCSFLRWGLAT